MTREEIMAMRAAASMLAADAERDHRRIGHADVPPINVEWI